MPFYTSTWGPVYYEFSGPAAAPVVLFTHGVAMDHQTFASQQPALTSHYRVVTWDMPGHGQSFPLTEPLRYDMVADCLLGILDEIGSQCAVLVGLSLGGHIGQFIAYHHPERVIACVDIGSTALHMGFNKVNRSLLKVYLYLSAFIPSTWFYAWFARDKARHPDTRCYLQASAARMGKHQMLHISRAMLQEGSRGIPAAPAQPLLITHGEHEQFLLVRHLRRWQQSVPGNRYAVIPAAGHIANQDNPDAFNQDLLAFLKACTNGNL